MKQGFLNWVKRSMRVWNRSKGKDVRVYRYYIKGMEGWNDGKENYC